MARLGVDYETVKQTAVKLLSRIVSDTEIKKLKTTISEFS